MTLITRMIQFGIFLSDWAPVWIAGGRGYNACANESAPYTGTNTNVPAGSSMGEAFVLCTQSFFQSHELTVSEINEFKDGFESTPLSE